MAKKAAGKKKVAKKALKKVAGGVGQHDVLQVARRRRSKCSCEEIC